MVDEKRINEVLNTYQKGKDYHFVLASTYPSFVEIAISTFAKNYFGDILGCMPTSLIKKEMIPKGYLVTSLFIYGSDCKPILIHDIKSVKYDHLGLEIHYHNGGKRIYEGGLYVEEVYHLLCALVSDTKDERNYSNEFMMRYCILSYEDDGGYEFELAFQPKKSIAAKMYKIKEEEVLGYLDNSLYGEFHPAFVVTKDFIYSDYFISHKQEPIDLWDITSIEIKRHRLIITHHDQSKTIHYASVYGYDLKNLIELYKENVDDTKNRI